MRPPHGSAPPTFKVRFTETEKSAADPRVGNRIVPGDPRGSTPRVVQGGRSSGGGVRLRRITTSDDTAERPGSTGGQRHPSTALRISARLACAAAAIAALSLLARESRENGRTGPPPGAMAGDAPTVMSEAPKPFVPSVGVAVRPAVPTAMAAPRFRLDDPDALEPARAEGTRIDPASGRREETLNQGAFPNIEAPYLRLTVGDTGQGDPTPGLFVTLVRRAADGPGLSVIRTGERGRLATKFGLIETLEATFSGPLDRVCTGFAGSAGAALRFEGWLCAPLGQAPEPRAVACALDALVPLAPGVPGFDGPRDPACRPAPDTRTGSLAVVGKRKNEAQVRRNTQARP